jgi:hypothetical protein
MAASRARPGPEREVLVIVLVVLWCLSVATPANATNTGWDPDDMAGRLDLRWVGAYGQDSGMVRLDISLWDPVRRWMLNRHPTTGPPRYLHVTSESLPQVGIYGVGHVFFDIEVQRWVMDWADAGLEFRASVSHPNPYLFQVWFPVDVGEYAWGLGVTSCEHVRSADPSCDQIPGEDGGLDP